MIDISEYRRRIGCFNGGIKSSKKWLFNKDCDNNTCPGYDTHNEFLKFGFLFYVYYVLILFISIPCILLNTRYSNRTCIGVLPSDYSNSFGISGVTLCHIRLAYFILLSYLLNKFVRGHGPFRQDTKKSINPAAIIFPNLSTSRLRQAIASVIIFLLLLTFLMIAIVNTSLLNPGPNNLKVYYQNVQGLIPLSALGSTQPSLNRTKISELNYFIHVNKPDVILLNETWLKKSVRDHEVIEDTTYKIFRTDRSALSHPGDTRNPVKFKKNGGGVLIAVRSDIQATCTRISLRKGAEIVAVEINFNGSKFIFCTCYRVGTLGTENFASISNSIRSFFKSKRPKKIFIIGDLNLSSATWPLDNPPSDSTEKLFTDTFSELGLIQCINRPTHYKGAFW